MRRLAVGIPLVIGLLVAGSLWSQRDLVDTTLAPVEITDTQQSFDALPELLNNTTTAIVGTVDEVEVGRTYTDPNNPDAGFISLLANVDVDLTLYGVDTSKIVVEQESTLLDGTPITVGGANPLAKGDRVVLFLVEGTTLQNRFFGIVGPQGRYELDNTSSPAVLQAIGIDNPSSTPSFDGLDIEEVSRRIDLQLASDTPLFPGGTTTYAVPEDNSATTDHNNAKNRSR